MATRNPNCCIPHCPAKRSGKFEAPLCDRHVYKVHGEVQEMINAVRSGELRMQHEHEREPYVPPPGFVYIAETKDGLIKIGYSINPKNRMHSLRTSLICRTPGTLRDEKAMHHHFGKHWAHGEYFRNEGELAEYVDALRSGRLANPLSVLDS